MWLSALPQCCIPQRLTVHVPNMVSDNANLAPPKMLLAVGVQGGIVTVMVTVTNSV